MESFFGIGRNPLPISFKTAYILPCRLEDSPLRPFLCLTLLDDILAVATRNKAYKPYKKGNIDVDHTRA